MENTNPRIFINVRVFAGDKVKPAADASYINLLWENFHLDHSFNIGAKMQKNKEIGTIDSWGPFFRVSLDLIIHSSQKLDQYYSVLAFKGNGGTSNCCEHGDRIPAILVSRNDALNEHLNFCNSVYNNGNYYYDFTINLNTWYNIIIEQKLGDRKQVRIICVV